MTNSAEIINFPEKESEQNREHLKVAQLKDGYTRIANELLEAAMSHSLTLRQLRVLLAVIRKTYGFNKKADIISGSQLAEITKLTRQKCSTALCELVELKIINRSSSRSQISVNKNIYEWLSEPKTGSYNQNGFTEPKTGSVCEPKTGSESEPKLGHTKDIIKDIIKDNNNTVPTTKKLTQIKLPLNRKDTFHHVSEDDYNEYLELYPAANITIEFRKMYAWLKSNPKRKKTASGIGRFIHNWLSKAQDRAPSQPMPPQQTLRDKINNISWADGLEV
jgi:phage replication O-like protein O